MKIELTGNFIKAEELEGGEIIEFLDAGTLSEITSPEGKTKKVINFQVLLNGEERNFTPNKGNLGVFVEAWGDESENWIGKKFKVKLVKVKVFGEVKNSIDAKPIKNGKTIEGKEVKSVKI